MDVGGAAPVRPTGRRAIAVGGPLALALVVVVWAVLLVAGFALLYLPHVPSSFTGPPEHAGDPATPLAVSFSLVTLSTLGYGDMTPSSDGLQLLAPLEALVGFGLLSASIAWLLSIHPVLARRRSLAYDVTLLARAERETGLTAEDELQELHRRVVEVERDLDAYPITLYFAELDPRFSLASALPVLSSLLDRLEETELRAAARLHAAVLREALDDLGDTIGAFPGFGGLGRREALARYAEHHSPPNGHP